MFHKSRTVDVTQILGNKISSALVLIIPGCKWTHINMCLLHCIIQMNFLLLDLHLPITPTFHNIHLSKVHTDAIVLKCSLQLTIVRSLRMIDWVKLQGKPLRFVTLFDIIVKLTLTIAWVSATCLYNKSKACSLREKVTIHQVATMLAASENVIFVGHNHLLTTGTADTSL